MKHLTFSAKKCPPADLSWPNPWQAWYQVLIQWLDEIHQENTSSHKSWSQEEKKMNALRQTQQWLEIKDNWSRALEWSNKKGGNYYPEIIEAVSKGWELSSSPALVNKWKATPEIGILSFVMIKTLMARFGTFSPDHCVVDGRWAPLVGESWQQWNKDIQEAVLQSKFLHEVLWQSGRFDGLVENWDLKNLITSESRPDQGMLLLPGTINRSTTDSAGAIWNYGPHKQALGPKYFTEGVGGYLECWFMGVVNPGLKDWLDRAMRHQIHLGSSLVKEKAEGEGVKDHDKEWCRWLGLMRSSPDAAREWANFQYKKGCRWSWMGFSGLLAWEHLSNFESWEKDLSRKSGAIRWDSKKQLDFFEFHKEVAVLRVEKEKPPSGEDFNLFWAQALLNMEEKRFLDQQTLEVWATDFLKGYWAQLEYCPAFELSCHLRNAWRSRLSPQEWSEIEKKAEKNWVLYRNRPVPSGALRVSQWESLSIQDLSLSPEWVKKGEKPSYLASLQEYYLMAHVVGSSINLRDNKVELDWSVVPHGRLERENYFGVDSTGEYAEMSGGVNRHARDLCEIFDILNEDRPLSKIELDRLKKTEHKISKEDPVFKEITALKKELFGVCLAHLQGLYLKSQWSDQKIKHPRKNKRL